ncbi:MAG TPA: DUF1887 family CARF protein [Pyrinomonadaceae bacterium]|nr:DUF1887 family CARF protein [Pyrinomonadaceae bacterium]HLE62650.1 DUF1887 family CARF protein [Pyrinomonadaceae bacterium]
MKSEALNSGITMVCLVGEQPVANLLPVRHCLPARVILVYSERTKQVSQNLQQLIAKAAEVSSHKLDVYNLNSVKTRLGEIVSNDEPLLFNITGGTKTMALAAFMLAKQYQRPFCYLQSEGGKSLLASYDFNCEEIHLIEETEIAETLTIDDYLRVHGMTYCLTREIEALEQQVFDCLKPHVSEVLVGVGCGTLELDLVIRCGNQVGIAEVKTGRAAQRKTGIDQLSTATQREFLGTYTTRFLIVDRELPPNNRELALAHNINVIELVEDRSNGLSEGDCEKLILGVRKGLGCN